MIPDSLGQIKKATVGEKTVYQLLKKVLLPDDEWWVWYEPSASLTQKHGDFLILSLRHGLILVEIKDWSLSYIQSATPIYFTVNKGGKPQQLDNPMSQARKVQLEIRNLLEKRDSLTQTNERYKGRLRFPTTECVIFTHMTRAEADNKGLIDEKILSHDKCLFKDDLDVDLTDKESRNNFVTRLLSTFSHKFSFEPLSKIELDAIRYALFPEIRVNPPKNLDLDFILNDDELIKVLDREQETTAKSLGAGHRIVKGVAGSGKSLVATYRAQHLLNVNPDWKILVVCFNITLRGFLGASLHDAHLKPYRSPNGAGSIEVKHYDALLKDLTHIALPMKDKEEWGEYSKRRAKVLIDYVDEHSDFQKYDAIIVDEGQDFTEEMLAAILKILGEHNSLLFCTDPAQNMFGRKRFSWKSVGLQVQGKKPTHLTKSYRNTQPILQLCTKFKGDEVLVDSSEESENNQALQANVSACRAGDEPKLIPINNLNEMVDYIAKDIQIHLKNGVRLNEFAVIIMESSSKKKLKEIIPKELSQRLVNNGLPENSVTEIFEREQKLKIDLRHESVKVLMTDSCKGLEFKIVYFVGLGAVKEESDTLRKTAYVGMTRAKDYLTVIYSKDSKNTFIVDLEKALEEVKKGA